MSKQYHIRWKPNDEQRLRKAVNNFNAKRRRLIKKDPSLEKVLPEKVTLKEMKNLIQTRRDLNREIKSLERFTAYKPGKTKKGKPKAQPHDIITITGDNYSITTTRWQYQEMTRSKTHIDKTRRERHEQLVEMARTDRGKKLGYTIGQFGMGRVEERQLDPLVLFTKNMTNKEFNKKFKTIRKERQSQYWSNRELMLKQNYIESLTTNYGRDDIKPVIEAIQKMDFDDFYVTFKQEGGNFELSYPLDDAQSEAYLEGLKSIWMPETPEDDLDFSDEVPEFDSVNKPLKTSRNISKVDPNSNQVKPQTTKRKNKK